MDAACDFSIGTFTKNTNFSVIRELSLPKLYHLGWILSYAECLSHDNILALFVRSWATLLFHL